MVAGVYLASVTDVVVVAAPFLTAAAGLGGIALGARLQSSGQRQRWLDDRRLDTYAAIAAEFSRMTNLMDNAYEAYVPPIPDSFDMRRGLAVASAAPVARGALSHHRYGPRHPGR